MREITYMPQEEPVAEKFTVHYDEGDWQRSDFWDGQ